jgi:hypothetical protein
MRTSLLLIVASCIAGQGVGGSPAAEKTESAALPDQQPLGGDSTVVRPDSAEALQQLATRLQQAYAREDAQAVLQITRGLLPNEEQILAALAPDVSAEDRAKVMEWHAALSKDDKSLLKLLAMQAAQTKVVVHSATTEQLAGKESAPEAIQKFPGGAAEAARKGVLRPGRKFHEVEFLEPGKDAGMRFHLFYWNGSSWSMLGPIWRKVRR